MITKTFTMPTKRDYKAEYKKFQSSTKSKKYRAELNKYNRKKGTYGNGDGKDASHKGGKIVGFEKESVNRGRAEKSRLKKEANMPDFNPMIDKALDEVIEEYTMSRKGVIDKIATLAKANRYGTVDGTQMNGKSAKEIIAIYNHPKMKKFKKAMADYTVDDFVNLSIKLKKVLGIKVEAKVSINKKEMDKLHKGDKIEKDGTEIIFKEEDLMNENPAAIAAAQRMVVQNKMGKKVSVMTAKNASYKEKDPSAHNKAKSIWDRIKARFKKEGMNESIDCLCEACWKGYEKKGMKTMFGKRYPNCVKKKKSESVNEVSDKQKRKIYKKAFGKEYDDPKRKQAPLPLDIAYKVALNRLKKKEGVKEYGTPSLTTMQLRDIAKHTGAKEAAIKRFLKKSTKVKSSDLTTFIHVAKKDGYKATNTSPSKKKQNASIVMKAINGDKSAEKQIQKTLTDKGLTKNYGVKEGLGDRISKISKKYAKGQKKSKKALKNKKGPYQEGVNENSAEKAKIVKFLIKYGNNPKEVKPWVDKHYKKAKGDRSGATPAQLAQYISFLTANESVNEDVWTPAETKAVDKIDGEFQKMMAKKGIEPYSVEASRLWRSAGFNKKMRKIFGKNESVNEARLDPKQLLQQLGGNKFIMMTGAKNLAVDKAKNTLHMKIGRNAKGISHLRIKLTGADLYDMEFLQIRAGNIKVKAKVKGIYADQLQKMFTKHTGMYTSLGTMGR